MPRTSLLPERIIQSRPICSSSSKRIWSCPQGLHQGRRPISLVAVRKPTPDTLHQLRLGNDQEIEERLWADPQARQFVLAVPLHELWVAPLPELVGVLGQPARGPELGVEEVSMRSYSIVAMPRRRWSSLTSAWRTCQRLSGCWTSSTTASA